MLPMIHPGHLECGIPGKYFPKSPGMAIPAQLNSFQTLFTLASNTVEYTSHECKLGRTNENSLAISGSEQPFTSCGTLGSRSLLGIVPGSPLIYVTSVPFKSHPRHTRLAFVSTHSHGLALCRDKRSLLESSHLSSLLSDTHLGRG